MKRIHRLKNSAVYVVFVVLIFISAIIYILYVSDYNKPVLEVYGTETSTFHTIDDTINCFTADLISNHNKCYLPVNNTIEKSRLNNENAAKKNSEKIYNQQKNRLKEILSEKGLVKRADKYIYAILDKLYENYQSWQNTNLNLPDLYTFVDEYLIDSVEKVNKVFFYEENSSEGKELDGRGVTDHDRNVFILYSDDETIDSDYLDIEVLFHELIHCKQIAETPNFENEELEDAFSFYDILIEGGATYYSRFVQKKTLFQCGSNIINNSSGTKEISYNKEYCIGYLNLVEMYNKLIYLTENTLSTELFNGSNQKKSLFLLISDRYGNRLTEELLTCINKWSEYYNNDIYINDTLFDLSVKIEKLFLQCIKIDIDSLDINKPDDILYFAELYRNYKLMFMPQIFENEVNVTKDVLEIKKYDTALVDKIIASKAVRKFSDNEVLNKMATSILIYDSPEEFPGYDKEKYDSYYLPSDIDVSTYSYSEKGNTGKMVFNFYDNHQECDVELSIWFNDKDIIKICGRENNIHSQ